MEKLSYLNRKEAIFITKHNELWMLPTLLQAKEGVTKGFLIYGLIADIFPKNVWKNVENGMFMLIMLCW